MRRWWRGWAHSPRARTCWPGLCTAVVPGHPVLLGRDHWAAVIESATGDEGAKGYLAGRRPTRVECGDLAAGHDIDSRG